MVEVGKIGGETLVLDGRYISIFRAGKLVWKRAYRGYILPDGNLYSYRRRVRITELSGNTLTDYQVKIEIGARDPIFAHARSAGEDIRFCYYPEENMIPYWIEKFDPVAEEAIIWVKVPSIPANSEIEIFMYYGNPTVASASDGEATFDFFDDFEGTSLDSAKWNDAGFAGYDGMAGYYKVENSLLKIYGDGSTWRILQAKAEFTDRIWECKLLKTDVNDHHYALTDAAGNNAQRVCLRDVGRDKDFDAQWRVDGGTFTYTYDLLTYQTNKYYTAKLRITSDGDGRVEVNGASAENSSSSWAGIDFTPVFWTYDTPEDWIDWVFLRKYASVEPSVSIGAEE